MSLIKSTIAVLLALGSASALAQNQPALTPTPSKPVDSATYGPVLDPQAAARPAPAAPASPQPAGEARPQAQEERAGQPPASKPLEVDPSARPAPQAVQPQGQQGQDASKRKPPARKGKQAVRRSVGQRIESTPRIAAPMPQPAPRAESQVAPRPVGPSSTQVVGCVGGNCTDTSGAGYNAAGPGNAAVSSSGQLCTRSGATLQCF